jgi:phage tail sheath protein FI
MRELGRGIYALDQADPVNLIVLPPYSSGAVPRRVLGDALVYAGKRRAMLIIDPPPAWRTVGDAIAGAPGYLAGRDVVLHFPRLRKPDPVRGGQVRDFAPSGAIAGMIARNDLNRGVWKAPAGPGAGLTGVEPALALSPADIERLTPIGVNCIRTLPGRGTVVWGARTRSEDPEWRYVNVRRLLLFLEESIDRGLSWTVFEPNDQTLWARVRTQTENFLYQLFRQGVFPGTKAEESFFVRCGPDTMTQDDIDQGRLIVMIGIAPVRPAEFVIFRIGRWLDPDDD